MRIAALALLFSAATLAQPSEPSPKAGAGPSPKSSAAARGKTQVTWYGHAAFVVKTPGGTTVAIDPWITNPKNPDKEAVSKLGKVDYVLVSHGHFDHVGDTVAIAKSSGAKLVGCYELGAALVSAGLPKESVGMETLGNAGGILKLTDEVSVALVPAVHSSGFQAGDNAPMQYAGAPLGFVLLIKGGPAIYHTGDTAEFAGMQHIGDRFHPDVMLAGMGGHFTMDPKDAARAARETGARVIVPMHFGTFPALTGTPEELEKELRAAGARGQMVRMQIGETKSF